MIKLRLDPRLLIFVVGTRAALAFGAGLLLAERIPQPRRRAMGLALVAIGAAPPFPRRWACSAAVNPWTVTIEPSLRRRPIHQMQQEKGEGEERTQ